MNGNSGVDTPARVEDTRVLNGLAASSASSFQRTCIGEIQEGEWSCGVFTLAVLIVATGSLLLFSGAVAYAGGNGAQTFTQTFKNQTDPPFVDFVPCRDFQAAITLTYNGVLHYIVNKAGDFWATGTMTGTVAALPLDPSNPSFTGRFTTWFGESDNNQNGVDHSTFTLHLTGSDGSTIMAHETAHVSSSASGLTVSFDKFRCG